MAAGDHNLARELRHRAALFLRDTPGDEWPTLTVNSQAAPDDWGADALCADLFVLALDGLSRMLRADPLRDAVDRMNMRKAELLAQAAELGRP